MNTASITIAFLMAAIVSGCAASSGEPGEPAKAKTEPPAKSVKISKDMTITNVPLTVDVELTESLRGVLVSAVADKSQAIRLTVGKLVPCPELAVTGFTVFVDKPDATAATSPDDPRCLGTVAFYPRKTLPNAASQTHVFAVKTAIEKSKIDLTQMKVLKFTFVPITDGGAPPATTKIPFGELELGAIPAK